MFEPRKRTAVYAVTGSPVFHSRSPDIFNAFFGKLGIGAVYTRLAAGSAREAVALAQSLELAGLNITAPFKEDMARWVGKFDRSSRAIGAVNVLIPDSPRPADRTTVPAGFSGRNTDHWGVVRALKTNGKDPYGSTAAVLGAGGAARAAAYSLIRAGAASVTFVNRSAERARRAALSLRCEWAPWDRAGNVLRNADILVSCLPTSAGIATPPPAGDLRSDAVVLDADYVGANTDGGRRFPSRRVIGGRAWLFHQAVPAFRLFTKCRVPPSIQKGVLNDLVKSGCRIRPNLALVGFMGAGKTTVGRIAATALNMEFADTDRLVEMSLGLAVPRIFREKGEEFFRAAEREVIRKIVPGSRRKVFSLGGGSIVDGEILRTIRAHCHVVWLWVSAGTAFERTRLAPRPILETYGPGPRAERLFNDRFPIYAAASDLVVANERGCPAETARRICDEMGQAF